jgi:hypothetical protein
MLYVLVGDIQNDKLKKENPDFRFYSLYPHHSCTTVCQENKNSNVDNFFPELDKNPPTSS